MRCLVRITFLMFGLLGIVPAGANVIDTFTVAQDPISGQTTLNLNLQAVADPGYFNPYLGTGSVTFNDGLGDTKTVSFSYPGPITLCECRAVHAQLHR